MFVLSRNERKNNKVMQGSTWRSHFNRSLLSASASHVTLARFSSSKMTVGPFISASSTDIVMLLCAHASGSVAESI